MNMAVYLSSPNFLGGKGREVEHRVGVQEIGSGNLWLGNRSGQGDNNVQYVYMVIIRELVGGGQWSKSVGKQC